MIMEPLNVPTYRLLSESERDDLTTVIKAAKEISDWFRILQGSDERQLKERVIANIIQEAKKIKSTNI